jgi:uncharacterized phage-associated protein
MKIVSEKKFNDLLFYLVSAFRDSGVVETKLMKLLYFTEANYYKSNNERLTRVNYFKNHYGPTPDFTVLRRAKKNLKKFLSIEVKDFNDRKITVYKVKDKNYSYSLMEKEMEEANKVFRIYSVLPSQQLSEISHLDPPFLAADEKIDFNYVNYRKEIEENFEPPFSMEERKSFDKDVSEDGFMKLFEYAKGRP